MDVDVGAGIVAGAEGKEGRLVGLAVYASGNFKNLLVPHLLEMCEMLGGIDIWLGGSSVDDC